MNPCRRRLCKTGLAVLPLIFSGGCAQRIPTPASENFWSGRIQVRKADNSAAHSAQFDLRGSATHGSLDLFTPLGTTLAHLQWDAGQATLETPTEHRTSASLSELLWQNLGMALPIDALFDWLSGIATAVPGWQVDLKELDQGRLNALYTGSPSSVHLRILLTR